MKITYATYLDHQKDIGYPIEFLMSKIPNLKVYCSDQENQDFLAHQGVDAEIIGISIVNPGSIAQAQNKSLDRAFETEEADYVVWVQADTHITEEGFDIIKKVCIPGNESKSFALNVKHLRLFHICQSDYYGVTIFGRDHKQRFVLDGAWTEYTGDTGDSRLGSECATIDIGYITIDQCKRHLIKHKTTWGNNNDFLKKLVGGKLSDKEFTQEYLKRSNVHGVIQEGDIYHDLIMEMGYGEEYSYTLDLAKDGKYTKFGILAYI